MEEYNSSLKLLKEIEKEIDKEQEEAEKERWRLLELKLRESNNEFLRYVSGYRERGLSYCPRDTQRTTGDGS